jgi:hypothetical protein
LVGHLGGYLLAGGDAQLLEDVGDVPVDGALREEQFLGNAPVG